MKAFMRIKMDRPFDPEKHYFSPGGYEVVTKDGKSYRFDFNETGWGVDPDDPTVIRADVRDEDYDTFPEAMEFRKKIHEITKFVECNVYTGECDEPEIRPIELLEFAINDCGTEYRKPLESTDFIDFRDNLGDKAKEYGQYDFDYMFKPTLLEQINKNWQEAMK